MSGNGRPKNFSQAIEELEEMLKNVKPQLDNLGERVGEEAGKAKVRIEEQVTENPWMALGIAGLIFFVLGFLFGCKGSRRSD